MTPWIWKFARVSFYVSGELENGSRFWELQKAKDAGALVGKVDWQNLYR
jgi:hypothetical protein